MARRVLAVALLSVVGVALACAAQPAPEGVVATPFDPAPYPWLAELEPLPPLVSLEARFPTPPGATRMTLAAGSFAAWLRSLPVRTDRSSVLGHHGRPIPAPAAAVVALDLGRGDLQQCADTVLRLHGEYLWARGRGHRAVYHFTSGDRSAYADWLAGERFEVAGRSVRRRLGHPRAPGHPTYRAWLQHLFIYAGTLSLGLDSEPLSGDGAVAPGDFFVDPGSPGHAVIVLDVAVGEDGSRLGLVGQGYTPAQELHVVELDGEVWLSLPAAASGSLVTPSWTPFAAGSVRRFRDLG